MNEWSYTSAPPLLLHSILRGDLYRESYLIYGGYSIDGKTAEHGTDHSPHCEVNNVFPRNYSLPEFHSTKAHGHGASLSLSIVFVCVGL